jgi:hypothetical protein
MPPIDDDARERERERETRERERKATRAARKADGFF